MINIVSFLLRNLNIKLWIGCSYKYGIDPHRTLANSPLCIHTEGVTHFGTGHFLIKKCAIISNFSSFLLCFSQTPQNPTQHPMCFENFF